MNPEAYLKARLAAIKSEDLLEDEKKMLSLGQIEYFISRRLLSKSFRKNFLKPETKELIKNKVAQSVRENKPIYLIFAFGGYKNHWVEEFSPKAEWAELMHLIYICELLTPIAKAYKPGIFLEYESECDATIHHNNTTQADIDSYTKTFKALIEFIKPYVESNIEFNYITLSEQYDTEKFFSEMKELVPERTEKLREEHKNDLEDVLKRPLFNLKRKGAEDLTSKSDEEIEEIALSSLAFNNVFLEEDYKIRADYFNGGERISMVGAYCSEEENPDNWIAINSCTRSENAFWTSRGVLFSSEGSFFDDVLGPNAYAKLGYKVKLEKVALFDGDLSYLNTIPVVGE